MGWSAQTSLERGYVACEGYLEGGLPFNRLGEWHFCRENKRSKKTGARKPSTWLGSDVVTGGGANGVYARGGVRTPGGIRPA